MHLPPPGPRMGTHCLLAASGYSIVHILQHLYITWHGCLVVYTLQGIYIILAWFVVWIYGLGYVHLGSHITLARSLQLYLN